MTAEETKKTIIEATQILAKERAISIMPLLTYRDGLALIFDMDTDFTVHNEVKKLAKLRKLFRKTPGVTVRKLARAFKLNTHVLNYESGYKYVTTETGKELVNKNGRRTLTRMTCLV